MSAVDYETPESVTVHYASAADGVTLYRGDCIEVMRSLPSESVHAVVTDPPYGLEFMGKGWDKFTSAEFEAWCTEWATGCLRILKPGGHLLAFGGSRTWHRLVAGIEDAGFEIRDSIAWLYGSGFPKSLDVSKAIDKAGGNAHLAPQIAAAIKEARIAHGWTKAQADAAFCNGSTLYSWYEGRPRGIQTPTPEVFARMVEAWPELAPWAEAVAEVEREVTGRYRSGLAEGSAGVGASGEGKERRDRPATEAARAWQGWGTALKPAHEPIVVARKPLAGTVAANVLAHGTGALNIDGCRVEGGTRPLIIKTGEKSPGSSFDTAHSRQDPNGTTAGRWPANVMLDESQAAALDAQGGKSLPSRFFYVAKAPKSERPIVDGVVHPTVKPLALMRYLVRLVTPSGGTVLEPFAGSGATVEACLLEGFECIAIEREADYLPLVVARVERARAGRASAPDTEAAA